MTGNAEDHLATLLSRPGFDEVARLSRNRHWFTYLPHLWNEQQRQACLLWLLTPTEGHDQGDYFIKRLLSATIEQAQEQAVSIPTPVSRDNNAQSNGAERHLTLINQSYGSAVAAQEVQFIDVDESYRYIDLLVVDPDNQVVILIERKDGTCEHDNQLTRYLNHVVEQCGSSYSIFPLLMDSHNANHNASEKGYVQLDDTWLIEAIDEVLNNNELEPTVRWNLSTLCNYVFAEHWDAKREPYYKGSNEAFNRFAEANADTLRHLFQSPCTHETQNGNSITVHEADHQELIWTLLSESDREQQAKPVSIHCHARYFDTLKELAGYSGLTPVATAIMAKWNDMYAHVYFYRNTPILEATCVHGWDAHGGYSSQDDIYWPFYLVVTAQDEQEDEKSSMPKRMGSGGRRYFLRAGASRSCPKELQPLATRFAAQVNSEQWMGGFRKFEGTNWTYRRTKRTEEVTNFSLDSHSLLHEEIENFRRIVHDAINSM